MYEGALFKLHYFITIQLYSLFALIQIVGTALWLYPDRRELLRNASSCDFFVLKRNTDNGRKAEHKRYVLLDFDYNSLANSLNEKIDLQENDDRMQIGERYILLKLCNSD